MPLISIPPLTLVCVNHALASHRPPERPEGELTTMQRVPGWHGVSGIYAPADIGPTGPRTGATSGMIIPVGTFVCEVCGYVEMYHASILDPDTWKLPGM